MVEAARFPIAVVDPFRLQLESFAAAVRGTDAPVPTLAESVVDAFTLDALLASANERTAITIDLPQAVRHALAGANPAPTRAT